MKGVSMPDDCGYLEKHFENSLRNMQINAGSYVKYTRVCPYCRTDPKKDTCVNCGAPQGPAMATVVTPTACKEIVNSMAEGLINVPILERKLK